MVANNPPSRRRPIRRSAVLGVVAMVSIGLLPGAGEARAQSVDDLQQKARQVAERLDRLNERSSQLNEDYLDKQDALAKLQADLERLKAASAEAGQNVESNKAQAREYAVQAYTQSGGEEAASMAASMVELGVSEAYLDALRGHRDDAVEGLSAAISDLDARATEIRTTEQKVQTELDAQARVREELQRTIDEHEQVQATVQGQLAAAVRAEQERIEQERIRAAEAEARAEAARRAAEAQERQAAIARATVPAAATPDSPTQRTTTTTSTTAPADQPRATTTVPRNEDGSTESDDAAENDKDETPTTEPPAPSVPGPNGAAATAIAAARRHLGLAYRFGGSSPSTGFDCSGLTSWAWAQAGVGIPRTSRAQYAAGIKIPISALEPGDLVAFGNPIHHIGLYIGGGQMIHSPHTGDVVKISSIYSSGSPKAVRIR